MARSCRRFMSFAVCLYGSLTVEMGMGPVFHTTSACAHTARALFRIARAQRGRAMRKARGRIRGERSELRGYEIGMGWDAGHAREMRHRLFSARLRGNRARLAPARCGALHARHATWQTPVCLRRGRAHPALALGGHGACFPIPANFAHCPVTGGGCRRYPSTPRAPQPTPPRLAASAGSVRGSSGVRLPPSCPDSVGHPRSIGVLPSVHATIGSLRRHPPPCEKTARRFLFGNYMPDFYLSCVAAL